MQRRSSGSSMSGGMQGYTCSTSRDTCSPCEQPWMYIVTLLGSAFSSAIVYHVLTIMTVDAVVDTRGLHSAVMRKHVWVAVLWLVYPLIILAACLVIDVVLVYLVDPLLEHIRVLWARDSESVFTRLATRWHPVFKESSQICDLDVAVSEEAWQLFISILQAVRYDPFEDLTLFAQNPRGGLECIHMVLSEDELNQAQGLPVLLHQGALEDYARCDLRLCTLRSISSTRPLANFQRISLS